MQRTPIVVALLLLSAAALSACGGSEPEGTPAEVLVARERAAGLFAEESMQLAAAALEPLLDQNPIPAEDLVRLGIMDLIVGDLPVVADPAQVQRGVRRLEQSIEIDPDNPAPYFVLATHWRNFGGFEGADRALPLAERAAELAPDDDPTQLLLAKSLRDAAYDEADEAKSAQLTRQAETIFLRQIDEGVEFLGSWMLPTLYQYSGFLYDDDRPDESEACRLRWRELLDRGLTRPSPTDMQRGNLGKLAFPSPEGSLAKPQREISFSARQDSSWPESLRSLRATALESRAHPISIADVDPTVDRSRTSIGGRPAGSVQVDAHLEALSLIGDDGRAVWRMDEVDGAWSSRLMWSSDRELSAWALLDLGEDRGIQEIFRGEDEQGRPYLLGETKQKRDSEGNAFQKVERGIVPSDLELVVSVGTQLLLVAPEIDDPIEIVNLPSPAAQLVPVDIDHDGDVDLAVVGSFGLRLFRHDGAEGLLGVALSEDGEPGAFVDATAQFGITDQRPLTWLVPEDLDTDNDVDLLAGGPGGLLWLTSDRNERWTDRSADLPTAMTADREPVVADFDSNGVPDVFEPSSGTLWLDRFGDGYRAGPVLTAAPEASSPRSLDIDLDGVVDIVWSADGSVGGWLAPGTESRVELEPIEHDGGPTVIADLDRDCRLELAAVGAEVGELDGATGIRIDLTGVKDNPRGVGAIVEVRSGPIYRRIYWRGVPELIGVDGRETADVIRVTWPNGVLQSELDTPPCGRRVLRQIEGLVGSCPFLYAWNGTTFEFISDVIGITPLGLPMAPGMLVPPDHDEYVLVSGEQLVPREDGSLVLQFTEELREVTYLDRASLIAIDHPEDTEVFPTERFSFPPFPEAHTHLVEPTSPVLSALGSDGRDWAPELAATDGELAEPFESYNGQWLGLATPHTLELRFDADAVRNAEQLRLLMCGWLYWTDASVNVAAARHPGYEFVPPILQVPDGQGGWRDAGPPVGFPAGKTKTMVLDVTGLIDPEDPRLRVFSTLRLFWDSIRLATDGDDAPRRETTLEAVSASLYERGFSEPLFLGGDRRLEWFEWDRLAPAPRWNQHPGEYTRFGSVLPLLEEIDDKFVIMGSGDAMELVFDGNALPDLPDGWRRDYLVFLDGWAKDRDPNTYGAEHVEPLPFHGMSGYPYGEDESYPDTEEHRAYRAEWNTRGPKRWLPSLADQTPHRARD